LHLKAEGSKSESPGHKRTPSSEIKPPADYQRGSLKGLFDAKVEPKTASPVASPSSPSNESQTKPQELTTSGKDNKEPIKPVVFPKEGMRRESGKDLSKDARARFKPAQEGKAPAPSPDEVDDAENDGEDDGASHHGKPVASPNADPHPKVSNVNLLETIPADVVDKVKNWKVRSAAMHGGKGKTTSKTHPFRPPASFQEAIDFLKSQSVKSCTIVFTNNSALGFADGKYVDFDNFEDDDDD